MPTFTLRTTEPKTVAWHELVVGERFFDKDGKAYRKVKIGSLHWTIDEDTGIDVETPHPLYREKPGARVTLGSLKVTDYFYLEGEFRQKTCSNLSTSGTRSLKFFDSYREILDSTEVTPVELVLT